MLSTKEVAKKFNVSGETIRNWDRKGILSADFITPSGRRFYSEEQVERLYSSGIRVLPTHVKEN